MRTHIVLAFALASCAFAACSSDSIDSNEQARRAYLGLDKSVGKSLTLGFQGFNDASSANIPTEQTTGDHGGMLAITGQVDQGASSNKQMRLYVGMVGYTDGPIVVDSNNDTIQVAYDTSTDTTMQPFLQLSLHNFPNGTFTGTLTGDYHLSGDLMSDVTLNLTMSGQTQDDGGGHTVRKPGTTTITGTAVSGDGTYNVQVTL